MILCFPMNVAPGMESGGGCGDTRLTAFAEVEMRTTTACIAGILAATFTSRTATGSFDPAFTVAVYNVAQLPRGTLARAEALAAEIFNSAGIDLHWADATVSNQMDLLNDFSMTPATGCTQRLHSESVRVEILSHAPPGFALQALGYALPCAERGVQVTIYADRLEAVSQHTPAAFYRVLGHALAHEIGHVLLRSSTHENGGVMKRVWSRNDWQRAAVTVVPFTTNEARRMLQELRRTQMGHVLAAGNRR